MRDGRLVLSCEHGGNEIPSQYRPLFRGRDRVLRSHRGFDPGALDLAQTIRSWTGAPLTYATISRLVVELNRTIGHPQLFSDYMSALDGDDRLHLIRKVYLPYRRKVEASIDRVIRHEGVAIHVGVHTFTPVLRGKRREVDIGLLYDPARAKEKAFCDLVICRLAETLPRVTVRRNSPYSGASDGLTTTLRLKLPAARYLGIELEVNQRFVRAGAKRWDAVRKATAAALVLALQDFE